MCHVKRKGCLAEMGFRQGSRLAQHGNLILEHIAYPLTRERMEFGAACRIPEIDDWQAETRFQTMTRALRIRAEQLDPRGAMDLLSGKFGFLCQYDRKTGKDTVWSTLYDLRKKEIWRAEGNPSRKKFKKDKRFRFAG